MYFTGTTHLHSPEPFHALEPFQVLKPETADSFHIILLSTEVKEKSYLGSRFSSSLNLLLIITPKASVMHVKLIDEYSKWF